MLRRRVDGGSLISSGGGTLGSESGGLLGNGSGGTLGSVSALGLVAGNTVKSFLMASLVGFPLESEGVAGEGVRSSCLRASRAAAILSFDDVWGSGNFWGRKTTVGQVLVLFVEGM